MAPRLAEIGHGIDCNRTEIVGVHTAGKTNPDQRQSRSKTIPIKGHLMDLQLAGRVAVVTAASKGIGIAVTRTLLDEGARVVAVSRRSTPELDAIAGRDLVHVAADLMEPDAPAAAVNRAAELFGRLDILVNNAGGPPPGARLPRFGFATPTDADW